MDKIVIQTEHISKAFSGEEVVKRCSISVKQGEIYGLLGVNGAGKTTLLKLISGLLEPTEGSASVFGHDSRRERIQVLNRLGILIEMPYFYEHLTARENMEIHLQYMKVAADVEEVIRRVGLDPGNHRPVSSYSMGMRQRLGIARAIAHKPDVLLLDEPINGLDPVVIREMRSLFRDLSDQGTTLVISSHILSEIEQTADRIGILAYGKLIMEEDMEALKREHPGDLEDYLINKMNGGV